jgi:alpha-tubulin suppressor-like RCC1 family protein
MLGSSAAVPLLEERLRHGNVEARLRRLAASCGSSGSSNDATDAAGPDASTPIEGGAVTDSGAGIDSAPTADAGGPADGQSGVDAPSADAGRPEPSVLVRAGLDATCAIVSGAVECWGSNGAGQLGNGSFDVNDDNPDPAPSPLSPALQATSLALGEQSACASDGSTAWCWGANLYGEVSPTSAGTMDCGGVSCNPSPTAVAGVSAGVSALAAGFVWSCALGSSGNVQCWGQDGWGGLGRADASTATPPVTVAIGGAVDRITNGAEGDFVCARRSADRAVLCWGQNNLGQLGEAANGLVNTTPVRVGAFAAISVAAGADTACAVLDDGSVQCWGSDGSVQSGDFPAGELGHDPAGDAMCPGYGLCDPTPTPVVGLTGAREVVVGNDFACAVKQDDTVVCWGDATSGVLGSDPAIYADAGVVPFTFHPTPVAGLSNVAHLAAGAAHVCAVTWDSKVYCWGDNSSKQLGTTLGGGATSTWVPQLVAGL